MVLVDLLSKTGRFYAPAKHLVKDAELGQCEIVVSEVTVAEASKLDGAPNVPDLVEGFLANKYIRRFPVTSSVSAEASRLIREYDLETCDALIMATAIIHEAKTLYCHDGKARKKIRSSQKLPSDVATVLCGMRVLSPLHDESLCTRAGIPVGSEINVQVNHGSTQHKRESAQAGAEAAVGEGEASEPREHVLPAAEPIHEAGCEHLNTSKEVMMGQKTGDRICNDCGETFTKAELDQIRERQAEKNRDGS